MAGSAKTVAPRLYSKNTMKLTATVKLLPTAEQATLLRNTLRVANSACAAISKVAWEQQTFSRDALHERTYYDSKVQYGLGSQMAIRCIGKVVDAYKLDHTTPRTFQRDGAMPYDSRMLGYDLPHQTVSIWVMGDGKRGRIAVPFVCGDYHLTLLQAQRGESDLVYRDGHFYLYATCTIQEAPLANVTEFLGVDLGIVNIAADNDGQRYSGKHLNNLRHRHFRLRQKLQKKGTKSARRRLRARKRKERRFAKDVNHTISKRLVAKAKGTQRGIALEELTGIRESVTVRKSQRRSHHAWAFHDLRHKIEYKARLWGVPVVVIDPRNTSRTCPVCGLIDKRNRQTQATFTCIACGFSAHADSVAAGIIASRAVVNLPNVSTTERL